MYRKLSSNQKFVLILIVVCIAAVSLLSSGYILSHADHDCVGDDCPVCVHINVCMNILSNITGICLIICLALTFSDHLAYIWSNIELFIRRENTPVGLKVQMNN